MAVCQLFVIMLLRRWAQLLSRPAGEDNPKAMFYSTGKVRGRARSQPRALTTTVVACSRTQMEVAALRPWRARDWVLAALALRRPHARRMLVHAARAAAVAALLRAARRVQPAIYVGVVRRTASAPLPAHCSCSALVPHAIEPLYVSLMHMQAPWARRALLRGVAI